MEPYSTPVDVNRVIKFFVSGFQDYLNILRFVFFLLSLECQLDKKLLQLLVAVVYTELLKTEEMGHMTVYDKVKSIITESLINVLFSQ